MIALDINFNGGDTDPLLVAKLAQCDPHTIATRIVPELSQHFRDHLISLPRNKNSWPSTGFWEAAARSVHGVALGGDAVVQADKLGLAQRLYGGTITARNAKNLTIPICAEAYGTTVADWGYENLTLVILADGRKFLALWLGSTSRKQAYKQSKLTRLTSRAETTSKRVNSFRAALADQAVASTEAPAAKTPKKPDVIIFNGTGSGNGERSFELKFLFRLKNDVEQDPNPNVLPPDLQEFAIEQVRRATA